MKVQSPALKALSGIRHAFFTRKGGVSTGYRAPDLRSVVPGYYYTTQRGAGVIVSNPDLKPEESTSYEFGFAYDGAAYSFAATYFHTDFENKIQYAPLGYFKAAGGPRTRTSSAPAPRAWS